MKKKDSVAVFREVNYSSCPDFYLFLTCYCGKASLRAETLEKDAFTSGFTVACASVLLGLHLLSYTGRPLGVKGRVIVKVSTRSLFLQFKLLVGVFRLLAECSSIQSDEYPPACTSIGELSRLSTIVKWWRRQIVRDGDVPVRCRETNDDIREKCHARST